MSMPFSPEQVDAFLRQANTAVLATVDASGRPHAVPVWYLWTGQRFEMIGGANSAKLRHIERNGRAALCIDRRDGRPAHVTAEGPCHLGGTATREWRRQLHTHYRGAQAAEQVVAGDGHLGQRFILLQPERWYGWGSLE